MNRTSWLSSIPSHWTVRRAAHVIDMDVGGTPSTSRPEYFDGDIPWLTIADMTSESITRCEKYLSRTGVEAARIPWSRKGDLLYSFKLSIGKIAFTEIDLVTNEAIASIHSSSRIDLRYAYWMLPLAYEAAASRNIYGAPILNQQQLRAARLPMPPLSEQQQIADYLDHETAEIDSAINEQIRLISLIRERQSASINLAYETARHKSTTLQPVKYSFLVNPSYNDSTKRFPEKSTYLPMSAISEFGAVDTSWLRPTDEMMAGYTYVENGDVVLAKVTPCFENGKGAVIATLPNGLGFATTEVTCFRPMGPIKSEYLGVVLQTSRFRLGGEAEMTGAGGLRRVPDRYMMNFRIAQLGLSDQQDLVARVDKIDRDSQKLIGDLTLAIDLARERRAALITAAVTGQIDVTARNKPAAEQLEDDVAQGLHREYA